MSRSKKKHPASGWKYHSARIAPKKMYRRIRRSRENQMVRSLFYVPEEDELLPKQDNFDLKWDHDYSGYWGITAESYWKHDAYRNWFDSKNEFLNWFDKHYVRK